MPERSYRGLAIASLVLGVVSLVMALIPGAALGSAIPGLVFGILGRASPHRGMAIAGIILCSGAIAVTSLLGILLVAVPLIMAFSQVVPR